MAAAGGAAGIQKSLDRIQQQVRAGAYYEAQQMYKTVYHRCRSRGQAADSHQVLVAGACQQLASQQLTCGVELANMLVEAYVEDKAPADGPRLEALFAILGALPQPLQLADGAGGAAELEELGRFVTSALKWAHKAGASDDTVARMHDAFAGWVFSAYGWRQFGKAAIHFSRGADADAYARALAAVSEQAGAGGREAPLFIARAVLQTLACAHAATAERQLRHARELLGACKAAMPPAALSAPLVHFCELLLQALAARKQALMALLQAQYGPSLSLDPSFEAYLASIEQTFFSVRPAGGAGGGMLGGLLRALLEGDEMDED